MGGGFGWRRGARFGYGIGAYANPYMYGAPYDYAPEMSPKQEADMLREQVKAMQEEIKILNEQIGILEKNASEEKKK